MHAPLVSVVIPTFNRAHALARTLDSVLAQSHRNLEAIVVDDGSTDATRELVGAYTDPRVRYIAQPNAGVSSARNTGLNAACGRLIALLDSDDVWMPWKLEVQVACMQHRPDLVLTWTDMTAVGPGGEVTSERHLRRMYTSYQWFRNEKLFTEAIDLASLCPAVPQVAGQMFRIGDIYGPIVTGNLVHTSTLVVQRHHAEAVDGYRRMSTTEDYDFHLRLCRLGAVGLVDVPAIYYQRGMPDRITRPENRVHFAASYLTVAEEELRERRNHIPLTAGMIRTALADGHRWLGEELLLSGAKAHGRCELLRSIQLAPSRRAVSVLAKSFVPVRAREWVKRPGMLQTPGRTAD